MSAQISEMPRQFKQAIAIMLDIFLSVFAMWMAFSLRFETFHIPTGQQIYAYGISLFLFLPFFFQFGLYQTIFRYAGLSSLKAMAYACGLYGALLFAILVVLKLPIVPRSAGITQPLLFFFLVSYSRLLGAALLQRFLRPKTQRHRTLIYGAGEAGVSAGSSIGASDRYNVIAYIDDNPSKHGRQVNGVSIYSPDNVGDLVDRYGITDVLLAMPNLSIARRREIISVLANFRLRVRSIPSMNDLLTGRSNITELQELRISDLLDRPAITAPEGMPIVKDRRVLVTGGAGSIGSELCRQLLSLSPSKLVLFDHNEYGVYKEHRALLELARKDNIECELLPRIGSIRDANCIEKLIDDVHPDLIFHAAAYKHVPLVEENPFEAVKNNIIGTWNVVQAATRADVSNFVLISTDKAVRPTNIMGASKRAAEIVVQAVANEVNEGRIDGPICSMVRFGNVLGSSGSVVPLFRQQIKDGGPITITDPEVTRYFMTIPEAVSLVLRASGMARGGEVFVLDMGESVKIIQLAKKMISLSGLTERTETHPSGDIEIVSIGLRPGEKLYEELLIGDDPMETENPNIMMAHEEFLDLTDTEEMVDRFEEAAENADYAAVRALFTQYVSGFGPAARIDANQEVRKAAE